MLRMLWGLQLCCLVFGRLVAGLAVFTNPSGVDGANHYAIGDPINITWEDAEDYTEMSMGIANSASGLIYWLISNERYTANNYQWNIVLGNGLTLSTGQIYNFVMVNDTDFSLEVASSKFVLSAASTTTTTTSPTTTSKPATTMATTLSTTLTTSTPTPSASSTNPQPASNLISSSPGLSTGAAAGIGVGAGLTALLVGALGFWLWRRKRASKPQPMNGGSGEGTGGYEYSKVAGSSSPTHASGSPHMPKEGSLHGAAEYGGESGGGQQLAELPVQRSHAELPGGGGGCGTGEWAVTTELGLDSERRF